MPRETMSRVARTKTAKAAVLCGTAVLSVWRAAVKLLTPAPHIVVKCSRCNARVTEEQRRVEPHCLLAWKTTEDGTPVCPTCRYVESINRHARAAYQAWIDAGSPEYPPEEHDIITSGKCPSCGATLDAPMGGGCRHSELHFVLDGSTEY